MQARYLTRAVAPDEYDAAAARSPEMCPLRYLGDTRSGRQVLMIGIRLSTDLPLGYSFSR